MFEAMRGLGHLECKLLVCGTPQLFFRVSKHCIEYPLFLIFYTLLAPEIKYKVGKCLVSKKRYIGLDLDKNGFDTY